MGTTVLFCYLFEYLEKQKKTLPTWMFKLEKNKMPETRETKQWLNTMIKSTKNFVLFANSLFESKNFDS